MNYEDAMAQTPTAARAVIAADRATARDDSPGGAAKPRWVKRDSDFSVTVVFASCRLASEFERQMITAGAGQARSLAPVSVAEPVAWRMFDGEGGYAYREEAPTEQDIEWVGRYGRKYEPLYTTHDTSTRAQAPDSAA
jgi:hypothetical protein